MRAVGFDVEDFTAEEMETIRETVNDADEPTPVIVTLQDPVLALTMDHAVVLLGMERDATGSENVTVMDPLTGSIETHSFARFWTYWDFAGQCAFVIRP